ncbi:MAG: radical SAM protein [Candidatus Micrarchaeota archaeon]
MDEERKIVFGYNGGTFSRKELEDAIKKGKPLTLDMSIISGCLNKCVFCGYRAPSGEGALKPKEIFDVIYQFRDIGGRSVKFVGEGEPLLRKDIFEILKKIKECGMIPVVFTCGDVLGNDALAYEFHHSSGMELVGRLGEAGATVMLKYDARKQDEISGRAGYSEMRENALERLIAAGFNLFSPTHLGFGSVALKKNLGELPKIFENALRKNIYPLFCPLMPIGEARDRRKRDEMGISREQMIELSARLHFTAWEYGIPFKGAADFLGGLPCDIARAGFFIDWNGWIKLCESEEAIGNARWLGLENAWSIIVYAKGGKYNGKHNCTPGSGNCYSKRVLGIIPDGFETEVKRKVFDFMNRNRNKFGSKKIEAMKNARYVLA